MSIKRPSRQYLISALREPAPCDSCKFSQRCKTGFACVTFIAYTEGKHWSLNDEYRRPRKRLYEQVFGEPVLSGGRPGVVPMGTLESSRSGA